MMYPTMDRPRAFAVKAPAVRARPKAALKLPARVQPVQAEKFPVGYRVIGMLAATAMLWGGLGFALFG